MIAVIPETIDEMAHALHSLTARGAAAFGESQRFFHRNEQYYASARAYLAIWERNLHAQNDEAWNRLFPLAVRHELGNGWGAVLDAMRAIIAKPYLRSTDWATLMAPWSMAALIVNNDEEAIR